MNLSEIREKAKTLRSELRAINEVATPTEEQLDRGEAIMRELQKLERQRELAEEEQRQRKLDEIPAPKAGACDYDPQHPEGETRDAKPGAPVQVRSSKDIVDPGIGQGGITDNDEFYRAVFSKQYDPRLGAYEARASKLYDLPNTGFLVPESSTANIFDKAIETSVFWPKTVTYPIRNARSVVIPAFNDSDHSAGTLWGGVVMYWEGEAESLTESAGQVREMKLEVKGLKGYTTFSNELKAASPAFAGMIETKLGQALSWKIDDAILRGDGAGKPLGILSADCLVTVAKETSQAADTIVWDNIKKMYSRMIPASRQSAVWFANNDLVPQLLGLSQAIGTAGVPVPVMTESNGEFRILGRPVVFSEKMAAAGDVGDILFADLSYYAVGMLGAITIAQSEHAYFTYDKHAIRSTCYLDGQPLLNAAFTPYKGSLTLSPFVTLAARA